MGANPNTRWTVGLGVLASGTPLFAAASKNHTATVAVLLEAGANPNNPNYYLSVSRTPLFTAVSQPLGHTEVVAMLEAGANPNAPPTLLGFAKRMNAGGLLLTPLCNLDYCTREAGQYAETVEALIKAGATHPSVLSGILAVVGGLLCGCISTITFMLMFSALDPPSVLDLYVVPVVLLLIFGASFEASMAGIMQLLN